MQCCTCVAQVFSEPEQRLLLHAISFVHILLSCSKLHSQLLGAAACVNVCGFLLAGPLWHAAFLQLLQNHIAQERAGPRLGPQGLKSLFRAPVDAIYCELFQQRYISHKQQDARGGASGRKTLARAKRHPYLARYSLAANGILYVTRSGFCILAQGILVWCQKPQGCLQVLTWIWEIPRSGLRVRCSAKLSVTI